MSCIYFSCLRTKVFGCFKSTQASNCQSEASFVLTFLSFFVSLQEYNDVKVANDAFREEIINLHKERQELIRAVNSLGLKPDVVPLPEQEQNVLRSLGLTSQSGHLQDVKPEIKPKTYTVKESTNQSEEETDHTSQSKESKNNLNQSGRFTDPGSQSGDSAIKIDQSPKGKEPRDQKEDAEREEAVITQGKGENIFKRVRISINKSFTKNP